MFGQPTDVATVATPEHSPWERAALWLWAVLALAIAGRLLLATDPNHNNVYLTVLAPAANAFWSGHDLYLPGSGFRYPPLSAALLYPFAACGERWGSVLWRAVNLAVLALGVRATLRAGLPTELTDRQRALLLAVLAVTSLLSLNNGQSNPLLLGCLLWAAAGSLAGRSLGPAVAVTAAVMFKVYPLAFGLALATLRPRLGPWLLLGVAVVAGAPFLLQPADWVADQYAQLAATLAHEDRTGDFVHAYRDLRLVTAAVGLPMPPALFVGLQLLGGAAIVVTARALRARGGEHAAWTFTCAATLCWFLLLGPATEKATYQWLGPPLAWALIGAWRSGDRRRLLLAGLAAALVVADQLLRPSRATQAAHPCLRCLSAWATLLVVADLVLQTRTMLGRNGTQAGFARGGHDNAGVGH